MNDDELGKLLGISQSDQTIATADSFGTMVATAVARYYEQVIANGVPVEGALTLAGQFQSSYMMMLTSLTSLHIQHQRGE